MNRNVPAAFLAVLAVTACASGDKKPPRGDAVATAPEAAKKGPSRAQLRSAENAGPCPSIGVLYDASRVVDFASAEERFSNVAWTGEIWGVRGLCRYVGEDPIVMNVEVTMGFGRGPAAQGSRHVYRYWVAVTRRDRLPLAKQYFEAPAEFDGKSDRASSTQVIERIVIPRANAGVSGANFEVLVGFDVTDQQLAFNRDGKRFRVDVGQQ